ncbi:MAG: penicillin-binding protein activator [Rhodospirillales bacterium]|nr:penicillin-binding protein activator [Rhodospirillales bacterium]
MPATQDSSTNDGSAKQQASSNTTSSEIASLPVIDGPQYPATHAAKSDEMSASGSQTESQWQKMLEPYLTQTPTSTFGTAAQEPLVSPPAPPLLPFTDGTVRVGILLPLSGPNEQLGRSMLNAAQMAMFDFANTDFELLPHDTAGSSEQASHSATLTIGDGASLIVGPLLSSSVRAVAPIARAANVPVLAFSSDSSVAGDGVYTMGFLPENNTRRVLSYAINQGLRRYAILAPNTPYGAAVVSSARETLLQQGRILVDVVYYNSSGSNIEAVIRSLADYDYRRESLLEMRKQLESSEDEISVKALERLKLLETLGDLPFEALLIADGGERLQDVAAMLPFYDIDPKKVRILGTGQWDANGIGAEPALVGAWFAAPPAQTRSSFVQRYNELYGEYPPRLASMAYDAMALAAVLARGESSSPYVSSAFLFDRGYSGRDGIFRFTDSGTADRGLAVYEVRRRENIIIDDAPKSFAAVEN